MAEVTVSEDCATGLLRSRATLCSASPDEQAVNVGMAVKLATARSNCLRDRSMGLAGWMFISRISS
jgi:hypothetical protein